MTDWNSLYSNQGIRLTGNPALGQLEQGIADRKRQQALENNNYTNEIAKLNFGGARDADLTPLNAKYNDVLNTFSELRNTNDQNKRAQLGLQLKQKQNEFLQNIEQSKNANKQYMDVAHLPFQPNANLQDGAQKRILDLNKVSSFDPTWQTQYEGVAGNLFQPKPYDLLKATNEIAKPHVYDAGDDDKVANVAGVGKMIQRTKGKDFDVDAYGADIVNKMKGDPNGFGKEVMKVTGLTDPIAAAAAYTKSTAPTYQKGMGANTTFGARIETDADRMRMHAANRLYDINHPFPNQVAAGQMTPAQTLVTGMQQGIPGSGEKLISLAPQGQYGSQKPTIYINPKNGNHEFNFPAQTDQKAVVENNVLRAKFAKEFPGDDYDGGAPGYSKLKPEIVKPAKVYKLNPTSPDYASQVAQMGTEQNINFSHLNQIEALKGGHGQIPQVQFKGQNPTNYTIKGKPYKAESVQKAATASGMSVQEYLNELNK